MLFLVLFERKLATTDLADIKVKEDVLMLYWKQVTRAIRGIGVSQNISENI